MRLDKVLVQLSEQRRRVLGTEELPDRGCRRERCLLTTTAPGITRTALAGAASAAVAASRSAIVMSRTRRCKHRGPGPRCGGGRRQVRDVDIAAEVRVGVAARRGRP